MAMLHEAIKAGVLQALRGLFIGMPGVVEDYDSTTRKAVIKPLIQEPDSKGVLKSLKPIAAVPVAMPGTASAGLQLPIAIGDTGWISFSHRSMENWLDRGGDVPPGDPRMMDMTDAVFWPGLRPFNAANQAEDGNALVLRNGRAKLSLLDGKIAIGNDLAELLDLFDQFLTKIQGPAAVLVNTGTGIGGLGPTALIDVALIQAKLGQIKGSL